MNALQATLLVAGVIYFGGMTVLLLGGALGWLWDRLEEL